MTTNVDNDDDLRALLDGLGETHADVAEHLYAAGVTGYPESADSCPIANWLRSETGAREVVVDTENVVVRFGRSSVCGTPPGSVRDFIERFDGGDYPDLEEVSNP